jgi:hypothetical protein
MVSMAVEQRFLFAGDVDAADADASIRKTPVRVFQDLLLDEGIWAVKEAVQFERIEQLQNHLETNLPQNSKATRQRYAQSILKWFFPSGTPDSFARQVWTAYGGESLLREILRLLYLQAEPLVGLAVAEALYPIASGSLVPHSYLHQFLVRKTGQQSPKAEKRLKANLRKLGFLSRAKAGYDLLKDLSPSPTSVFLAFHQEYAVGGVRTIEFPTVIAHTFWRFLGMKSEDCLRAVFRQADSAGHLGKYVIADQLELLTPRYTLRELLQARVRL